MSFPIPAFKGRLIRMLCGCVHWQDFSDYYGPPIVFHCGKANSEHTASHYTMSDQECREFFYGIRSILQASAQIQGAMTMLKPKT